MIVQSSSQMVFLRLIKIYFMRTTFFQSWRGAGRTVFIAEFLTSPLLFLVTSLSSLSFINSLFPFTPPSLFPFSLSSPFYFSPSLPFPSLTLSLLPFLHFPFHLCPFSPSNLSYLPLSCSSPSSLLPLSIPPLSAPHSPYLPLSAPERGRDEDAVTGLFE